MQRRRTSYPRGRLHKPARRHGLLALLGPGLITGAADDDPSGIATYAQVGAKFAFGMCWLMLFSWPQMAAIREVSARIGRVTGRGIAGNIRAYYPPLLLHAMVALLLFANIINLGADLGAMGAALRLIVGGPGKIYVVFFAVLCAGLEIFLECERYVAILKWTTLSLFAYVATALVADVPWAEVGFRTVVPHVTWTKDYAVAIVAVFGTTISPYLFFRQSSEEAEEQRVSPTQEPLKRAPEQAPRELSRIRFDTCLGMALSNTIGLFILITAASVLNRHGATDIETSAQAARALQPIASGFASAVFSAGIIGTGLLAVPVLAGSAACALGEALRWPSGLARLPQDAKAFYGTIAVATLVGVGIVFTDLDPIKALFWSAFINGVVAEPLMAVMMVMTMNRRLMGRFMLPRPLWLIGWLATAVMAASVAITILAW